MVATDVTAGVRTPSAVSPYSIFAFSFPSPQRAACDFYTGASMAPFWLSERLRGLAPFRGISRVEHGVAKERDQCDGGYRSHE